ncbi:hypothetical protein C8R46DRAFT_1352840 [Mycena filopes]|nr:hypothetical protein C8R46DRAFT_1352840 [Mycena filopes]
MAVTASARMAGGPSWDDEVVPALRKRLEGESRILTKRISAAVSISSFDEHEQTRPSFSQAQRTSADRDRPRPERAATGAIASANAKSSSGANGVQTAPPKQRNRTYSTPKLSEIPTNRTTAKPTRIPKAATPRTRTGSISGTAGLNGGYVAANSSYTATNSYANASSANANANNINDALLAAAGLKLTKQPSQDTIHIPSRVRHTPGLLNEPAPFPPSSSAFTSPATSASHHNSNGAYYDAHEDGATYANDREDADADADAPPRPSTDSTERPFEHWYRGEISRNGGVGELKLGKRAEMLEIANYGHTLKQKEALREAERANPSRLGRGGEGRNGNGEAGGRGRKRSESVAGLDARSRESLYMDVDDEENRYYHEQHIRDEGPLTDLDNADLDAEMSDGDYYIQQHGQFATPTPTATPRQQQPPQASRIPGPSPGRITPTPTGQGRTTPQMQRGASEPPSFPASSSSISQSARQLGPAGAKRAATASPPPAAAASSSSANKKPRQAAATVSPSANARAKAKAKRTVSANQAQRQRERDGDRRSVAYYPEPDGEEGDMADAIPEWTQPVAPATGRWDDVVLPVVARKKGLDGLYTRADGSPKPKGKEEGVVAPAPGTFGWDHSKYRPPRDGDGIQMDEFGRPLPDEGASGDPNRTMNDEELAAFGQRPRYPPTEHERQAVGPQGQGQWQGQEQRPEPPRSPLPFSGYQGQVQQPAEGVIDLEAANAKFGAQPVEEDDAGAGCCKCVVM